VSDDPRRVWGEAWTLAFTFVGVIVIFTAVGHAVDRLAGTTPWFMVGGVFLGAGLGFAYLVTILFSRRGNGRGGSRGADKAEDQKQAESAGMRS
jgi:F0F1-type ATP synthase assembly protein I